jgi:hypothetical protein
MPKSRSRSRRNRKGGFEMSDLNPFGSSTGSSSATGSSWYNNLNPFAKKSDSTASYIAPTSYTPPASYTAPDTSYIAPDTSYTAPPATSMGYGGKRRRRRMRGGSVTPNVSLTNLASSAAPVSNMQTVQAQTLVGGRTKKRRHRHRHTKSCKKSCRKH